MNDTADFGAPHAFSDGIVAVIVNGVIAWSDAHPDEPVVRNGRILRALR